MSDIEEIRDWIETITTFKGDRLIGVAKLPLITAPFCKQKWTGGNGAYKWQTL